jgi:hypothetical protein
MGAAAIGSTKAASTIKIIGSLARYSNAKITDKLSVAGETFHQTANTVSFA